LKVSEGGINPPEWRAFCLAKHPKIFVALLFGFVTFTRSQWMWLLRASRRNDTERCCDDKLRDCDNEEEGLKESRR